MNTQLLSEAEQKKVMSTLMAMKEQAKNDPVYFIDTFCYTFNPKQAPFNLRFRLFPFQKRLVRDLVFSIRNGEDIFIDKTREMGVSYTILCTLLWFWLFEPASNFLIGSRKEDYVDNRRGGTTGNKEESLFGKIDYVLSRLPAYMLPKEFNKDRHFNYMSLVNPENGNAISGESSNPNFSRGGRQRAIFLDEFAFWGEGCFSEDTEVLTQNGWLPVNHINQQHKVYSMNDKGEAELMPVTDIQEVYARDLIAFENKSVNLHVTPDHNMLVKKRYYGNNKRKFLRIFDEKGRGINSNSQYYFRKAKDVIDQDHDFIPLTSTWVGGDKPDKIHGFNSEDFMEFLGWFVSEGHSSNKSENRKIGISQSRTANPENSQQIEELLVRMGLPVKYWSGSFYVTSGKLPKEMFEELCGLGKADKKYIPQEYLNLHRDLLLPLFDALVKGDGWNGKNGARGYATISKRLADNVQDLAQKVGVRASITKLPPQITKKAMGKHEVYILNFGYKQVAHLTNLKKEYKRYEKLAYCMTTPYHTLYVRRNGVASWSGNSAVWGATADTTNCRIIATTPGIAPSKAKRLRFGKDGEKIKIITLDYTLDPRKNKKWLDEQRERRSTEDFDREIMVNWETSITGRVYPEIESAAYGDFPFIVNQPLYCSWDFGLDGTAFGLWQQNPANGKYRLIDCYENVDQVIQFYFPFFGKTIDSKFQYSDDDLKAIRVLSQYTRQIHFGDPDVKKRSLVATTSTLQELAKAGIYVQSISKNDFYTRREITKVYLQKGIEVNQGARTENWIEAIKMARYPQREETSQATTPIEKPIHDWCLAGETMIRTLNGWFQVKDLVGKDFWVWSYDENRKRLVPKKAAKCWKSGLNKKTILVGIDDGHSIRCTPDHPFMLRDGTYVEAQDLKKGDSLMPFYEKNDGGYVDILLNDGSHGPEHQLVYSEVFGIKDQDSHIHHKDDCKWHNSPDNLEEIDPADHCSRTFSGIPNGKRSKIVPPYIPYSSRSIIYRECRFCGKEFVANYKTFFCSKDCVGSNDRRQLKERARTNVEYRDLMKIVNKNYEEKYKIKCDFCGYRRSRRTIKCPKCHNHKVRFVQKDMKRVDVYDIEVPDTHNFVAEGVVTHNTSHARTAMEYFFVNIDSYANISLNKPSWADRASDFTSSITKRLTSRSQVIRTRR